MIIDVDFNHRDRDGHVITQVPRGRIMQLRGDEQLTLRDPLEGLQAHATIAYVRLVKGSELAAFNVDWHSFADSGAP